MSGSFVADSAYQYVMIGQFFSNALTDTLHFADLNSVFPWYPRAYTLVDAVCVSASPEGCDMGQGADEVQADARPYVYPNPATDALVIRHAAGADAKVLDILDRTIRIRRLVPDYEDDQLDRLVVTDADGRLHWRDVSSLPAPPDNCEWTMGANPNPNHVWTAVGAADPAFPIRWP